MHLNEFGEMLQSLENYFNLHLTNGQRDIWWNKVKWANIADAKEAVEEITSTKRPMKSQFPSPSEFLKSIDDAKARRAVKVSEEDKKQAKTFFTGKYGIQLAKDCGVALRQGNILDIAKALQSLEEIYPDIGFKEQGVLMKNAIR